jgi:hypothetical protein
LPGVLRFVQIEDGKWAGPFLAFVRERVETAGLGGKRFREVLPGWLDAFARQNHLTLQRSLRQEDWEMILTQAAFHQVLAEERPNEPDWARQFRALARETAMRSPHDLLALRVPEEWSRRSGFSIYRRELLIAVETRCAENRRLLELN